MNTVPKITQAHIQATTIAPPNWNEYIASICNKAIEIALAEQQYEKDWLKLDAEKQQESEYIEITAEQARELGADKVEWFAPDAIPPSWFSCKGVVIIDCFRGTNEPIKYRAIKQAQPEPADNDSDFLKRFKENVSADVKRELQTEPADPHAALRVEYAKQVADGTTRFYLWEVLEGDAWKKRESINCFYPNLQYLCTDISCMVAKQGEPAKRMTRTEAQELQRSLGDTVEWDTPIGYHDAIGFEFDQKRTYTYAPKATIRLDGVMVTPEQAANEWEAKKETHYRFVKWETTDCFLDLSNDINFVPHSNEKFEYELRPKALKQVSWSDMPVGVTVCEIGQPEKMYEFRGFIGELILAEETADRQVTFHVFDDIEIELAPASEQLWIAVQDVDTSGVYQRELISKGINVSGSFGRIKVTGIAKGYVLGGAV